jgi:hypothetical protein
MQMAQEGVIECFLVVFLSPRPAHYEDDPRAIWGIDVAGYGIYERPPPFFPGLGVPAHLLRTSGATSDEAFKAMLDILRERKSLLTVESQLWQEIWSWLERHGRI